SQNTSFTSVVDRGVDSSGKVNVVTDTSNPPSVGSIMTMTISGDTSTIGNSGDLFNMEPATVVAANNNLAAWRPDIFELVSAKVNINLNDGNGTVDHNDFLNWTFGGIGAASSRSYVVTYKFRVTGTMASNLTVSPVQFLTSGGQVKHSDV